jgi:hypothetical protein
MLLIPPRMLLVVLAKMQRMPASLLAAPLHH